LIFDKYTFTLLDSWVRIAADLGDCLVHCRKQPRIVRAHCPADVGALAQHRVLLQFQPFQDLHPETGDPVIDDDGGQKIGRHHLHHILAFERAGNGDECDWRLALGSQPLIQFCQAVIKAG
jgi:hypothetical protein